MRFALSKMTNRPEVFGASDHGAPGGHLHRLRQPRPLAEVTRGVEVRHAGRMMTVRRALVVAEIEEPLFLIEIRLVEEHEQAPQDIEILGFLVVRDPAVAQPLENKADTVHLAVRARGAPERPAEAVRADEVGHHADVLLGIGAQGRQLAVAHAAVRVQLQRRADEDEGHHPVEVEVSAQPADGVVEEAGRAGLVDPVHHALDEPRGLVLLREPQAEAGDRLGDVERLPVVVVVAAVQELLVDPLLRLLDQALPDRVAVLGRAEAEEPEGRVREAVLRRRLGEHLGRHAARRQVDDVEALQGRLARGAVVFAECKRDVSRLIRAGFLAGGGEDGAVGLD